MQQRVYKTKIHDVDDLQNAWCKLGLTLNRTFSRLRLTSVAIVWDHDVHAGGGHFEHMLWNYCLFVSCGSSEHFMKLSM